MALRDLITFGLGPDAGSGVYPTVEQIATGVWAAVRATNNTAGSFGAVSEWASTGGLSAQETADAVNNLAPTGASGAAGSIRAEFAALADDAEIATAVAAAILVTPANKLATGASGVASANVTAVKDTLLTESVAGRLAAAFSTFGDVATPVATAASVNQTGDSYARLGAPAGASVSADMAAVKADTAAVKAKTDNLPASPSAVGSAMTLTAAYDAAKTAASQASVDDLPTNAELATALAGADDAVLAAIGALNDLSSAGAQAAAEAALAAYGTALQGSVDDLEGRLTATRAGYLDNLSAGAVATAASLAALNNLSSAQAQSAAAAALSAYDPATKTELDSAVAPLALETTALSVKAKTDNLPSDPADQSELLAAIAGVGAGSAPTKEEIRAEIDANSVRLAAIQLVTDAIDVSEVTLAPVNVLGHLTITAALTFETSITGIVTPQDWTNAVWTLKRSRRDLDTASIIKLVESNPGVGTDGVTVLNGAAPVSPLTAAAGALTIDAGAGTAGIRLTDDLTALLAVRPGLIWGLKFLRSNGDSKEYAGTADIDLSVVHGV